MYLETEYSNYKYLVESHDNFVILSNKNHISGSSGDIDSVPVIYNYFSPHYVFEGTYRSYDTFSFTNIENFFSDNIEDRGDFPLIFLCGFTLLFMIIFIINQLTKFVKKGGIFGSL